MSVQLLRVQDPRDNLEKARRKELERFAKANGVTEIQEGMPAQLMRKILRSKGLTNIEIPRRVLGQVQVPGTDAPVAEIDASEDLMRQWKQERSVADMSMQELRAEAKKRGLKQKRTDTADKLREMLNGENAPQRSE